MPATIASAPIPDLTNANGDDVDVQLGNAKFNKLRKS
jgi:hypothetical protein